MKIVHISKRYEFNFYSCPSFFLASHLPEKLKMDHFLQYQIINILSFKRKKEVRREGRKIFLKCQISSFDYSSNNKNILYHFPHSKSTVYHFPSPFPINYYKHIIQKNNFWLPTENLSTVFGVTLVRAAQRSSTLDCLAYNEYQVCTSLRFFRRFFPQKNHFALSSFFSSLYVLIRIFLLI